MLVDEAQNERMHVLTFVDIAKPNRLERLLIILVQGIFYNGFFLLYLLSPRTAHRVVGYFEEEAVIRYTRYLAEIEARRHENVPAPQLGIDYWALPADALVGRHHCGPCGRSGPPRREPGFRRHARRLAGSLAAQQFPDQFQ